MTEEKDRRVSIFDVDIFEPLLQKRARIVAILSAELHHLAENERIQEIIKILRKYNLLEDVNI